MVSRAPARRAQGGRGTHTWSRPEAKRSVSLPGSPPRQDAPADSPDANFIDASATRSPSSTKPERRGKGRVRFFSFLLPFPPFPPLLSPTSTKVVVQAKRGRLRREPGAQGRALEHGVVVAVRGGDGEGGERGAGGHVSGGRGRAVHAGSRRAAAALRPGRRRGRRRGAPGGRRGRRRGRQHRKKGETGVEGGRARVCLRRGLRARGRRAPGPPTRARPRASARRPALMDGCMDGSSRSTAHALAHTAAAPVNRRPLVQRPTRRRPPWPPGCPHHIDRTGSTSRRPEI